jgi:hypothetical protein
MPPWSTDPLPGDLAALRVQKFHGGGLLYLLGYILDESVCLIFLEAVVQSPFICSKADSS